MKRGILITGGGGLLGGLIADRLYSRADEFALVFVTSKVDKLAARYPNACVFSNAAFATSDAAFEGVDTVIHAGFSRLDDAAALMSSIEFTSDLMQRAIALGIYDLINISSRSVYGQTPLPWTEQSPVRPHSPYAVAKLTTELLASILNTSYGVNGGITSIRLAGLIHETLEARVLNKFVKAALEQHELSVTGGRQQFAFLHADDAADAIVALLDVPLSERKPLYNLASERRYTILELANEVARIGEDRHGERITVNFTPSDAALIDGMDGALFYSDVGWRPRITIDDMVTRLYIHAERTIRRECANC
ncbi:MAG: SDR family oxidoreductase [Clostridia bacterium]|nr:SDR family oxidoreductase [Clostridia bacterium]